MPPVTSSPSLWAPRAGKEASRAQRVPREWESATGPGSSAEDSWTACNQDFSSLRQKLWRGGEESHLKSSGKSAVSRSTLRGPVGKITKPHTIANRGMANIRLQKVFLKAWLSPFLLSPWVVEVNHVLCDHLVVDRPLQGVREQADHILLDLVLCEV